MAKLETSVSLPSQAKVLRTLKPPCILRSTELKEVGATILDMPNRTGAMDLAAPSYVLLVKRNLRALRVSA